MEACKLPEVASNLQETPEKIFTAKTPIIEMPWNGQRHILILNPIESIPEILVHTIPILICEKEKTVALRNHISVPDRPQDVNMSLSKRKLNNENGQRKEYHKKIINNMCPFKQN